jgi:hypothetical protein
MTERVLTITVFVACVAALPALHLTARRSPRLCELSTLFARLMATRATRVAVVLAWAWIGWHFLVTPPI